MAPTTTDPVRVAGAAVDLSGRIVQSSTIVASPTDNTETIIASLTLPANVNIISGVLLLCNANFTIGTSGVSGNLKIRQTSASGTTVVASGVVNAGVWAATQLTQLTVVGFDTAASSGQLYKATLTVGSGAAASTVSAVTLAALIL